MQWTEHGVDYAMALVLLVSMLVGVVRGFLFELLSLAGWFVAYFVARWFAADLAPHVPFGPPGSSMNHAASFAFLFIAVVIVWAIASRILRFLVHATPLSLPDRLLGALFGAMRGLLLLLAVATVISHTPLVKSAAWQASLGAHWLQEGLDALRPLLPAQVSNFLPGPQGAPAR